MDAKKKSDEKVVVVPRSAADVQRFKLEKLMKNPDKPVQIPEASEGKLPRVFNPPEFIRNIWGSSAGAGSGDFHVYRGIRRREYARQKFSAIKDKQDELDEEYIHKVVENKVKADERTAKKRAKRMKKKQKQKGKKPKLQETKKESESESEEEEEAEKVENGDSERTVDRPDTSDSDNK